MENVNQKIDQLEAILFEYPKVDCPVKHTFISGMYIREIFMPKNTWLTSLIHKTTHPFFVIKGVASVFSENNGEELLEAGYWGITKPNTRRVLYIHEDCTWVTVHKTNIQPKDNSEEEILKAVDIIGEQIIQKHENVILGGVLKNNTLHLSSIENENFLIE